jgi:hypothetical protein
MLFVAKCFLPLNPRQMYEMNISPSSSTSNLSLGENPLTTSDRWLTILSMYLGLKLKTQPIPAGLFLLPHAPLKKAKKYRT